MHCRLYQSWTQTALEASKYGPCSLMLDQMGDFIPGQGLTRYAPYKLGHTVALVALYALVGTRSCTKVGPNY